MSVKFPKCCMQLNLALFNVAHAVDQRTCISPTQLKTIFVWKFDQKNADKMLMHWDSLGDQ